MAGLADTGHNLLLRWFASSTSFVSTTEWATQLSVRASHVTTNPVGVSHNNMRHWDLFVSAPEARALLILAVRRIYVVVL